MKSFTSRLIATLIVTASTSVSAASSTDLTVKGLITPNACDLTISKGGIFDLGKISVNDLNEDLPTSVGRADFQLDVTCDEKSLIALNVVDNQSGTSTTSRALGLGLINGNQKIGYASMQFIPLHADTAAVAAIISSNSGATWRPIPSNAYLAPDEYVSAASLGGPNLPIEVKELSAELRVHAHIDAKKNLDLTNEVTIDGSATIEMVYL